MSETPTPAVAVETTDNRKLGPVSATYVSQASCPTDCPFRDSGCYAETGYTRYTTHRLNASPVRSPLAVARAEAAAIDTLTGDRLLRLRVVGDCRTDRAAETVAKAVARYVRRGGLPATGRKAWAYTHAWRAVRRQSWGQHTSVLASCETPADCRAAMARGYAAAIVLPHFGQEQAHDLDGLTVVPCPNQTRGVTCRDCGLCRDDERLLAAGQVIGFAAHGSGAAAVRERLRSLDVV